MFYVNWAKCTIHYDRPFIRELDEVEGTLYFCTATEGKPKISRETWAKATMKCSANGYKGNIFIRNGRVC